jgi:hypothetical protein
MEVASIQSLSNEIIAEVISYLDYGDQANVCYACRKFFHFRPYVIFSAIEIQTNWLKETEGQLTIPRRELLSHNAFLRILIRTFTFTQPTPHALNFLVTYFAQEMISAWMVPSNDFGAERRHNDSLDDERIYHRRYPLLRRLATILRYNSVGARIAAIVEEWLDREWTEIENDETVQLFMDPDFNQRPSQVDLEPRHHRVLYGFQSLALYPIVYYGPQTAASLDIRSRLNDETWTHPGFDRLKLWLSIPELWNTEIHHMELKEFPNPYRQFRRIQHRPLIHLVLFRCAEFLGFGLRVMSYCCSVEASTPYFDVALGSRFWFEEGFTGSVLYWNFHNFSFAGQYIELFKRPLVDLIRGYIRLFGPISLSDVVLNMVYFVHRRTLPVRMIVARTMMSELLIYGYEYLTDEAKDAIVDLMRDQHGRLVTNRDRHQDLGKDPARGERPAGWQRRS